MKDWKIRQEVYHKLNRSHTDDLNSVDIINTTETVKDAVRYFHETNIGWIYPSKSYMVAICYARWLGENFGGDPYEYLNDPDLLYGNDPYFIPYRESKKEYDQILIDINGWQFSETSGMVPDVKQYFLEEFMIDV
jgi:hypothetical protein